MTRLPDTAQTVPEFLNMQHVNVARGDAIVLHNITLRIATGEHVAILGPNGCGKSTLIKTITCECYPIVAPETSIHLLGRDRWDVSQLRQHLGVVEHDALVHFTLLDRGLHHADRSEALGRARAHRGLHVFGDALFEGHEVEMGLNVRI